MSVFTKKTNKMLKRKLERITNDILKRNGIEDMKADNVLNAKLIMAAVASKLIEAGSFMAHLTAGVALGAGAYAVATTYGWSKKLRLLSELGTLTVFGLSHGVCTALIKDFAEDWLDAIAQANGEHMIPCDDICEEGDETDAADADENEEEVSEEAETEEKEADNNLPTFADFKKAAGEAAFSAVEKGLKGAALITDKLAKKVCKEE